MSDWCLNKFDEDYPRACLSLEKCNRTFPTIKVHVPLESK